MLSGSRKTANYKKAARDRVSLAASSIDIESVGNVSTVIYDSSKVFKEDFDPFDEVISKIEKFQTLINILKAY